MNPANPGSCPKAVAWVFAVTLIVMQFQVGDPTREQFWLGQQSANAAVAFEVTRFIVSGDNPLRGESTIEVLRPFLGPHSGIERIQEASQVLEQTLRDAGYAFYRVTLPEQELKEGTVLLEVRSFKIVQLSILGLNEFSENNIRRSLPNIRIGVSPNIHVLSRDLAEANRHTAKNLQVTFSVNPDTGELEAKITVKDRSPSAQFAWIDNTGTDRTGNYRMGFGFQHSNLFDRDHSLTVTGTASPEKLDLVRQIGTQYRIPLYRFHADLEFIAADSTVDSATFANETFEVNGAGRVYGLRYRQGLARIGQYRHDVILSWFDKRFENDTRFLGGLAFDSQISSRPVGLEYRGAIKKRGLDADWYIGYYFNVDGNSNNNDEAYNKIRPGASSDWSTTKIGGALSLPVSEWTFKASLDAQLSNEPLVPGEQFTFGGMRTIRGVNESEFAEDRGVRTTLELWLPPTRFSAQLLGFIDYGYGRSSINLEKTTPRTMTVGSVGLGVRWAWQRRLRTRFDYGYVFEAPEPENTESTESGDSKVHFSVIYLF